MRRHMCGPTLENAKNLMIESVRGKPPGTPERLLGCETHCQSKFEGVPP